METIPQITLENNNKSFSIMRLHMLRSQYIAQMLAYMQAWYEDTNTAHRVSRMIDTLDLMVDIYNEEQDNETYDKKTFWDAISHLITKK